MLKDAPIGSPIFHIYNVLYLTLFTGVMTFAMLFVYYLTYEAPNPIKDVEKMLGNKVGSYNIVQKNITSTDLMMLSFEDQKRIESYFSGSEILRFYITDKETNEPIMTVVSVASGAFGGQVKALIGTDGEMVKGIYITDVSTETPGLGQRVAESGFQRQFIDKTPEMLPMDHLEWSTKGIDMISGATFSSASIVTSILKSFDLYKVGGF